MGVQPQSPIAWSPNGLSLAFVSGDKSIFIVTYTKLESGETEFVLSQTLVGHQNLVKCLLFHPTDSNTLISAGGDGFFVWNVKACRFTVHVHTSTQPGVAHETDIECMCWTHQGITLVTGSKDTDAMKAWYV
jgi:WD40 repeat protein